MCVEFVCTGCNFLFTNHCKDKPVEADPTAYDPHLPKPDPQPNPDPAIAAAARAIAESLPGQKKICPGPTRYEGRMKCETCVRVKGAIKKLEVLVFQAPFLLTDGLAGLDRLAEWERRGVEKWLCGRKRDWEDKAESREERHKVQERIEKMGLDGVADERKEHQGFGMSITPPKESAEKEETDEWW